MHKEIVCGQELLLHYCIVCTQSSHGSLRVIWRTKRTHLLSKLKAEGKLQSWSGTEWSNFILGSEWVTRQSRKACHRKGIAITERRLNWLLRACLLYWRTWTPIDLIVQQLPHSERHRGYRWMYTKWKYVVIISPANVGIKEKRLMQSFVDFFKPIIRWV